MKATTDWVRETFLHSQVGLAPVHSGELKQRLEDNDDIASATGG